jgi:hypothetical protein
MSRVIRNLAMGLILGVGLSERAVADQPEEVTICASSVVPNPLPQCGEYQGEWESAGRIEGFGTRLYTCFEFSGGGVAVKIDTTFISFSGDSISVERNTLLDWQNLDTCEAPQPNPCGLACENLLNARQGRWRIKEGTGDWANFRGVGELITFVNREYDGEGVCPGGSDGECNSRLCDAATGRCFRRVANEYFSGHAHEQNETD